MAKRMSTWAWLPGADVPVLVGHITEAGGETSFVYDRLYLSDPAAISLYEPELPLRSGQHRPRPGLSVPGCLRDAWPDGWSRLVIERRLRDRGEVDAADEFAYLRESGSDRIGAFDFTTDDSWQARGSRAATLEDLQNAADLVEAGEHLPPDLRDALDQESASGGMRPKAHLEAGGIAYLAKFSSRSDTRPVTKIEAVAMDLAHRCGIRAARTELVHVANRDVLLVERFDRVPGSLDQRHIVVSGATMLGLDPTLGARYASYYELADLLRSRSASADDARELFARITFNVIVGNTDDHARNHAALWDGRSLRLSPAYDICPQQRRGNETKQAMPIGRDGFRDANLAGCVARAHDYGLSTVEAVAIVTQQLASVHAHWDDAADKARLSAAERAALFGRAILNDSVLYGWDRYLPGATPI